MKIRSSQAARLATGLVIIALSGISACGAQPTTTTNQASAEPSAAPSTSASPSPVTPKPTTEPTTAKPTTQAPKPAKTTPAKPKPTPVKPTALMAKGASGDQVRELQSRLKQLDWYEGKVTGNYGDATVAAVKGFQGKRKLPATGEVDQATWKSLTKMTRMPTSDEMHNRLTAGPAILKAGATGDKVRELQARLKQIGWFAGEVTPNYGPATTQAVKDFQRKREIPVTGEVDQRTWDRLVGMTRKPSHNELHNVAPKPNTSGLDSRCLTGRAMCISKRTNTLVWVVNGKPQLKLDVRFGAYETPTRNGAFSVGWKAKDWVSTIYKSPMPYSMFFSGGQAVHYSSDFAARGYSGASHGCVNVRDLNSLKWLFGQVQVGDKVIVY